MLSPKRAFCISVALCIAFAVFLIFFCLYYNSSDMIFSKAEDETLMVGRDEDRPYEKYLEILPDRPLDINSATAEDFKKLPGIGDELSKRIVLHRQFVGPFISLEDIMQVDGISETLYAGFEHLICIGDSNENSGS